MSTTPSSNVGADASREWQPIETAPKDWTIVDLWVRWSDGAGIRYADSVWNGRDWVFRGEFELGDHIDKGARITHWMPLPTPPAGETK